MYYSSGEKLLIIVQHTFSLNVCSDVAHYSLSNHEEHSNNYAYELAHMQVGRQKDSTAGEF